MGDQHLTEKGIESLRVPQFASNPRQVDGLGTVVDVIYHGCVVSRALEGGSPTEETVQYVLPLFYALADLPHG